MNKTSPEEKEENETEQGENTHDEEPVTAIKNTKLRGPKLVSFDETRDDMDSYIHRFEQYARVQGWTKDTWAVYLGALLKGKSLVVYARLPRKEAQEYETLKVALLKRFNKTNNFMEVSLNGRNHLSSL
jgi:hypothetical protein